MVLKEIVWFCSNNSFSQFKKRSFPPNKEHVLWKIPQAHPLDMQMILSYHFPKKKKKSVVA